ncbi:unnamed protein product [Protopolystoma xenopodis]|uniref:Uncharacterized protein n=1 Tax=Protopolystoma xenopodis TaxID=117903 RepID=A0A3S5CGM1_9PLAT|nr:unnamed protein product [Protopolystoma xenopodis]
MPSEIFSHSFLISPLAVPNGNRISLSLIPLRPIVGVYIILPSQTLCCLAITCSHNSLLGRLTIPTCLCRTSSSNELSKCNRITLPNYHVEWSASFSSTIFSPLPLSTGPISFSIPNSSQISLNSSSRHQGESKPSFSCLLTFLIWFCCLLGLLVRSAFFFFSPLLEDIPSTLSLFLLLPRMCHSLAAGPTISVVGGVPEVIRRSLFHQVLQNDFRVSSQREQQMFLDRQRRFSMSTKAISEGCAISLLTPEQVPDSGFSASSWESQRMSPQMIR